ncbi:IMPACT family protein [Propionivibrio dicarboxylicus]|uniref:Uncharacterized protein, YigZ family n=1 Tax=Propionivibrio dicarboxylicus TaxID=83767 RepID=A0A1G8FV41_9RHOO|nr:YigZ family protein [Propionivibrio dicarboxylicus]SDH86003.1 uncharacterized protein, YigZ family [Propionivibrio dicarboxylicus]
MPKTLSAAVHSELIIRKSRFIGCVQPMANRPDAQKVVAELRARHPNANHVCWALLAGGQSAAVDDGEPSGTAGRPMLEVLRHQELEQVLATVIRYFGGVKLGASGLLRAYTDCIAHALLGAEKIDIVKTSILQCAVPYALEGLVRREVERIRASWLSIRHGEYVELEFALPDADAKMLIATLNEAAGGKIRWTTLQND